MHIKTIQIQRGISLKLGTSFIKPKILIEAEFDKDEDDPKELFEELQKTAELFWLKECLASIAELSETLEYDGTAEYAEKVIERIEELEKDDG